MHWPSTWTDPLAVAKAAQTSPVPASNAQVELQGKRIIYEALQAGQILNFEICTSRKKHGHHLLTVVSCCWFGLPSMFHFLGGCSATDCKPTVSCTPDHCETRPESKIGKIRSQIRQGQRRLHSKLFKGPLQSPSEKFTGRDSDHFAVQSQKRWDRHRARPGISAPGVVEEQNGVSDAAAQIWLYLPSQRHTARALISSDQFHRIATSLSLIYLGKHCHQYTRPRTVW